MVWDLGLISATWGSIERVRKSKYAGVTAFRSHRNADAVCVNRTHDHDLSSATIQPAKQSRRVACKANINAQCKHAA